MLIASYKDFSLAGWAWPHFWPAELACKCQGKGCRGEYWHDPAFLDALEALRAAMRRPIRINSGHRCAVRNALVRGAARSFHRRIAVDVSLANHDRYALRKAAIACGFTGIGLARSFIHLDRRAIPAEWTYDGAETSWRI
jgi:zinc D-Ala-D-Ala carboxypeptidase